MKINPLSSVTKQTNVFSIPGMLFTGSMKTFKIRNILLFGLSFFLLVSCSKSNDDVVAPEKAAPIIHEDEGNFYEYTIDGAIKGIGFGKPDYRSYYSEYVAFYFQSGYDSNVSITGLQKYFADNSGSRAFGIPIVVMPDSSKVLELGTFPIVKSRKTMRPADPEYEDILFSAYFTDYESGREFGRTTDTEGSITITNSGEGFYEGTFEFEAFEVDGPANSKVKIKGKFRQSLP